MTERALQIWSNTAAAHNDASQCYQRPVKDCLDMLDAAEYALSCNDCLLAYVRTATEIHAA